MEILRERLVTPDELIQISTPEQMPVLARIPQPVHVGLNIGAVLGQEAADAFVQYRVHSENKKFLDHKKAIEAERRFVEIAGFSPTELLERIYQIEETYGFSTRLPNLLLQNVGV